MVSDGQDDRGIPSGLDSRTAFSFLYTRHVIALAVSNNCLTEDGYSFSKLLNIMKEQGGYEYNILVYYEWWLMLIFNNLYAIGDDVLSCWIVFFKYITI